MSDEMIIVGDSLPVLSKAEAALPETLEGCYTLLRTQMSALERVNSVAYWYSGQILAHMKTQFDIDDPVAAAARETGLSERMLRYCAPVYTAFDCPQLKALCSKGMQWSTLRELAASSLDDFRERLIELFMEDRITDLEVRDFVAKLRNGVPLSVLMDEEGHPVIESGSDGTGEEDTRPIEKQFETARKKAVKRAKDFAADSEEFRTGLTGLLSDAVIDKDGHDKPAVVEKLLETEETLHKALMEAVELIRTVHLMCAKADYPFEILDARLEDIRNQFVNGPETTETK
jgi:hypothetical protein